MSHTRYFYFETDKLCWRKVGEDEDEDGPRKFIAMSDITNVEVLEPVGKFEFAVSLRREAKPYQLRAASMNDLQRWVSTLKIIQAVKEIESQSARR
mmetsp:Transcript_11121/g.30095  ORF Transcript_11121/g.30095 Transcript_11121/m.30095 type:complete len:96 (-) Transcript_11121:105-392(-)